MGRNTGRKRTKRYGSKRKEGKKKKERHEQRLDGWLTVSFSSPLLSSFALFLLLSLPSLLAFNRLAEQ